jgi:hypothetical protein
MMMGHNLYATAALALAATAISGRGTDWPDFRGPRADGLAPPTARPPLEWSESHHVRWKTPLHDHGWSSPVVMGNGIWVTAASEDGRTLHVLRVDRDSGTVTLDRVLFRDHEVEPLGNPVNTYASPSAVLEDGFAYIHFGSYGTACLDADTGETVWERRDLPCRHFRGPGSSPILYGDSLILTFDGVDQQYMTALDKRSGQTLWRTDRSVDFRDLGPDGLPMADGDLRKAYSTPIVVEFQGEPVMLTAAARAAYAYDPRTGRERWRVEHDGFSAASRPAVWRNLALLNTGYGNPDLLAVRLGGEGNITASHVAWVQRSGIPKRSSPVVDGDLVYLVADNGLATCLQAADGQIVWQERLRGNHSASPVLAAGRLYLCNEAGDTAVLETGRAFRVLARNSLDEGCLASPAVSGDMLILRTRQFLYGLGEDAPTDAPPDAQPDA